MFMMAALLLPVLLGFAGLIVDGGYYYSSRRQAQTASDEAALAAAHVLVAGGSVSVARAAAWEYAAANGFDNDGVSNTVEVRIPPASGEHVGDPDYVEVLVDEELPTFFIHVLVPDALHTRGRAVAGIYNGGGGPYAIFANQANCGNPDVLQIPGSTNVVNGRTHSNGDMKVGGSNNAFTGQTTYTCDLQNSGQNNTFVPPATQAPIQLLPVDYDYADFPCTMTFTQDTDLNSVSAAWVGGNQNSNQLLPGVYCSTRKLSLSGSDVSGNVTLVAMRNVNVSGSNFHLTPYWNNVLLFTEDNDLSALDVSGSGGEWIGLLLAPNGRAKVAGSGNISFSGGIIADTVLISGSDFSITGSSDADTGPNEVRLVE